MTLKDVYGPSKNERNYYGQREIPSLDMLLHVQNVRTIKTAQSILSEYRQAKGE